MRNRRRTTLWNATLVLCACAGFGCAPSTERPVAYDPVTMDPPPPHAEQPATAIVASIPSGADALIAYLFFADGPGPHPTAVLLEGYPGGFGVLDLTSPLRRAGWNVLMFHYRGAWGTPGEFTLGHALEDVGAVIAWLRTAQYENRTRVDSRRIALIGHSTGAALALLAAMGNQQLAAVVAIAPFNFGKAGRDVAAGPAGYDEWLARVQAPSIRLDAGGRTAVQELADRSAEFDLIARAAEAVRQPVLIVGGTKDKTCPPDEHIHPLATALGAAPACDVTAVVLDTDHSFWNQRVALARAVLDWLGARVR